MTSMVSTYLRSSRSPSSARVMRLPPSNRNGLVTTATVSALSSRAMLATIGVAPVPVPAPITPLPRRDEDHVGADERVADLIRVVQRRFAPDFRVRASSESVLPDADLRGGLGDPQRLHVRIDRDELDPFQACCDHRVDGVAAASTDADDLDLGSRDRLFFKLEHAIP